MKKIHMIMRLSFMNANINVFRGLAEHVFLLGSNRNCAKKER
jgi:hypothetical protein